MVKRTYEVKEKRIPAKTKKEALKIKSKWKKRGFQPFIIAHKPLRKKAYYKVVVISSFKQVK